jgi:hypothetical protein
MGFLITIKGFEIFGYTRGSQFFFFFQIKILFFYLRLYAPIFRNEITLNLKKNHYGLPVQYSTVSAKKNWQTSPNSILEEFFLFDKANPMQFLLAWTPFLLEWGLGLVFFGADCRYIWQAKIKKGDNSQRNHDLCYNFCIQTMFDSSLPPVVCSRAHVLFTLFVSVCV